MMDNLWLGVDPGGENCFGVAIVGANAQWTACVSCAEAAVQRMTERTQNTPPGAGVDAPLWWSAGPSGDRSADRWLRKRYKLSCGQIQSINSLRGAALVQGAMFVERIRGAFPNIPVTETHPKPLLKAINSNGKSFEERFSVRFDGMTEHERDALISAVAAREGFEGRWPHDLSADRHDFEQDPKSYWLAPVQYW